MIGPIPRKCNMCGYRINPDVALKAGVVSRLDYDRNFTINPIMSWCDLHLCWISDNEKCSDWLSFEQYEGEKKYM